MSNPFGHRIGVVGFAVLALAVSVSANAEEPSFTADVDQRQVSQDESVSLSLSVNSEGGSGGAEVQYEAPDFETINEYSSNFVKSFYDGTTGRFGMSHTQKLTKVLRPLKVGRLSIRHLQAKIKGKVYSAPDILIEVSASGAGTPPPRNYGGSGVGLRGAGKRINSREVVLRAEVDKDHAFKGEQVVISYYLYRRARVYNIQVDKFPELKAFLREEMEMPVMGTRLESEQTALDGVLYERSLLARYAVYPLQEGKLKVDPLGLKYNYFSSGGGMDDEGDPLFQFFRQSQARAGSSRSEPVVIDVTPLPAVGRPDSFSGGVGDFSVVAAVDKYEVRANEAVTLTLKVEGRGNLAAIGEPKAKWPENVELYDSKGKVNVNKGGVGSKIFEFLLIPRASGKVLLPSLAFSFFDPTKKAYVTTRTEPIEINVQPADPSGQSSTGQSLAVSGQAPPAVNPTDAAPKDDLRYLKPPSSFMGEKGGIWSWLYSLTMGISLLLIGWVLWDGVGRSLGIFRARRRGESEANRKKGEKRWQALREVLKKTENPSVPFLELDLSKAYEALSQVVLDTLDDAYQVGARSLPRSELRQLLVGERQMAEPLWSRIEQLLEFAELVQFASSAGAVSEQTARGDLKKWVGEAESVVRILERIASGASG